METQEPWTTEIEVVLRDLDGLGHVNNAVYVTYLETARNRYIAELTGKPLSLEFEFILARVEIDFRRPAELGDRVSVAITPTRIGRKSFDFAYALRRSGADRALLAEARSVQVAYDYRAGRSTELGGRLLEALRDAISAASTRPAPEG